MQTLASAGLNREFDDYVWVFLIDEIEILWWTDDHLAHTNDGIGGVRAEERHSGRHIVP